MVTSTLITTAIWKEGPAWLHPIIIGVAVLLACWAIWAVVRYITTERRAVAAMPSRSEYRWLADWDVVRFHRALLTYLKVHDWKIHTASAAGADRLLLSVQRDRHRVTMLLLRPGRTPAPDDVTFLREAQQRDGTWEAVMISDPVGAQPTPDDRAGPSLTMLSYEALPVLTDALDGGPEEERRARQLEVRPGALPLHPAGAEGPRPPLV